MRQSFIDPPGRRRPALVVAMLLGCGVAGPARADDVAPGVLASESQRLQQRFVVAADGWRKAVVALPDVKPHDALIRSLRIVVAPTPVPLLRVHRRLDGSTIVVSAGWLALLDELLRAQAVSVLAAGNAGCLSSYAAKVKAVVQDNRERAKHPARPQQAWPRLAPLVESGQKPEGCEALMPSDLRSPAVQERIEELSDAAALWLLTRMAAIVIALPVPKANDDPPVLAASSRTQSVAATEQADPERRAKQALDGYGLEQPAALSWMRAHAGELFDEKTVEALAR